MQGQGLGIYLLLGAVLTFPPRSAGLRQDCVVPPVDVVALWRVEISSSAWTF